MAEKSKLLSWSEYILARIVLGSIGLLPRRLSLSVGILTSRFCFLFLSKLKRVAMRNLEIAFPDMPDVERRRLLSGSIDNFGRYLAEISKFSRTKPEDLEKLVEFRFEDDFGDKEYFDTETANGRGTILVGPHLGNWEMGVFAYSATHGPIIYLARPLDNPLLEDYFANLRARFGNRSINKRNSFNKAIDTLKEGKILGLLPDVNVMSKDGIFVPFFGKPASTTVGVAMLAKRTKAMILPMCCVWQHDKQRYLAKSGRIIEYENTGDFKRDLAETTAKVTKAMEDFIREYPDQWIWIHKRWKTRLPGEESVYD